MNPSETAAECETDRLVLELYIVGDMPRSTAAIANLEALRQKHFPDAAVEVIDVWQQPRRILSNGVFITPLLVKVSPSPGCQIVGDLSDENRVLKALKAGLA